MNTFVEKVTVVTGASRGLGKSIALELAEAGARNFFSKSIHAPIGFLMLSGIALPF